MHTSYATVLTLFFSASIGSPVVRRDTSTCDCDKAATGPDVSIKPISQPSTTTAELCVQACKGNSQCQSCAFGLPPMNDAPSCMLFGVPGAHIPPQAEEIHVFDKACTEVPAEPPTHEKPRGPKPAGQMQTTPPTPVESPKNKKPAGGNGHGTNEPGKQEEPYKVANPTKPMPNPKPPTQEKQIQSPHGVPTQNKQVQTAKDKPAGKQAGGGTDCDDDSAPNQYSKRTAGTSHPAPAIKAVKSRKDECSVTPRGPASSSPAPIKTHGGVSSLTACLDLCKKTSGCHSCEFGRQKSNGPQQCLLFQVPVESLPPPPKGASIVGSNAGC